MNDNKKNILKSILWKMNEITSEVKEEIVESSATSMNEILPDELKQVLHVHVNGKIAEEIELTYNFNEEQLKIYKELINDSYDYLWNGVIYDLIDTGIVSYGDKTILNGQI